VKAAICLALHQLVQSSINQSLPNPYGNSFASNKTNIKNLLKTQGGVATIGGRGFTGRRTKHIKNSS